MIRALSAFAWLRWRMFLNAFERGGSRDTVERFSVAIEKLGPVLAAVLLVPSALALAVLGASGGYALAAGSSHSLLVEIGRYLLIPVAILTIVGPIMLPASDRTNPVRLLLLPISRATLFVAQSASALGDPWMVLMLPLVFGLPLGLVAGGAVTAALATLAAALLLVLTLVGVSSLAASLLHLLVRDRRRGEMVALVFILVVPMLGMLPALLDPGGRRQRRSAEEATVRRGAEEAPGRRGAEQASKREDRPVPAWLGTAEKALALTPTETFYRATRAASRGDAADAASSMVTLAASAGLFLGLGAWAFARVLDSPGLTGARRTVPMREAWRRRIPGLSTGASAVAFAQLRLALRTPRGRQILLSPLMVLVVFGVLMRRRASGFETTAEVLQGGLGVATLSSFVSLLSALQLMVNQFAVDNAGLTLALLSPLGDREYLSGKAVGNALIAGIPAAVVVAAAAVALPGGHAALWLSLPLALIATYLPLAPVAAMCAAVFPRIVNLNSIGRRGNAHGFANLLGLLALVASAAPCGLIVLLGTAWLKRPGLVPLMLAVWCAVVYGIGRLLFIPAASMFRARRENLALLRTTGSS